MRPASQRPSLTLLSEGRTLSESSRRSASADPALDTFSFPDGHEFELPRAWGVKQYILQNPRHFRTSAFRCLDPGDPLHSEGGITCFSVPSGYKLEDIPLKRIQR